VSEIVVGSPTRGISTERLDEQKLGMLRHWGEGLTRDEREEVRAAGRAILLLADEVEQLHVDLWHARDDGAKPTPEPVEESLGTTLRDRLRGLRLSKSE
jgi:hypothetical protein